MSNNSGVIKLPIGNVKRLPSGSQIEMVFDIDKFFNQYIDKDGGTVYENYSPVAIKKLGTEQQSNISITGSFNTTFDANEYPGYTGMAYITVRRNSVGLALASGGYGVSFRPSSEGNIKSQIDNVTDNGDGTYDVTLVDATSFPTGGGLSYITKYTILESDPNNNVRSVPFHYLSKTGNVLEDCTFSSNITPEEDDYIAKAADNVFVVDNDLIGSDIYNNKQIEHETGVMSYVKSSSVEILKDTTYYYRLIISESNSISFSLSTTESGLDSATSEIITTGAYVPLAEYLQTANMDAFGLSVVNTKGYKWYWGPVKISSVAGEYPVCYYEMNVSNMPDMVAANLRGYGEGYNTSDLKVYGLDLYIWNETNGVWELLLTNSSEDMVTGTNPVLISEEFDRNTYQTINSIVKLYCTTKHPSGDMTGEDAKINIDYMKLSASMNSSVNVGSCMDIYIEDTNIIKSDTTVTVSQDYINISDFDNKVIVFVDSVSLVTATGDLALVNGVDYVMHVNDENYRNSGRVEYLLKVGRNISGQVKISYYYSKCVMAAQNYALSEHSSYKGSDVLFKHFNIHMIEVSSEVVGIATYLNTYIGTIEADVNGGYALTWSGFTSYLSTLGVSATTLQITDSYYEEGVRRVNYMFESGDEIDITKLEIFMVKEILDA